MSHSDPLTDALIGLAFGGYWVFNGMRLWLQKREILNRPLSKVKSAAMGDVELCGEAQAEKLMKAPYSGTDCVYCAYQVEVPDRNGWRQVEQGVHQSVFYLDDGTGRILVNPEGALFFGQDTYQNVVEEGLFGRKRYTEQMISPGQIVFLEGYISTIRHVVNGSSQEEPIVSKWSDRKYVLSTFSEEGLLMQWGWKIPLQVFGGAILFLGGLWYVVFRFQLNAIIR